MGLRSGLIVALLLVGCGNPLSPGDLQDWAAARARWDRRPLPNYQFEIAISCFCATEVNQWTRVQVVGGRVTEAQALGSASPHPVGLLSYWPTLEELFARALTAGRAEGVRRVEARYDPTHGFPIYLDISYDPAIQDAGVVFTIRNVRLLGDCGPVEWARVSRQADWLPTRCSLRAGRGSVAPTGA